ncbi:MAG: ABC transporter permease [Ardenticatenaceae bacterium]|nr:ABC transporter permease [Ardenticatenaceae bacterium]HBY97119.1 peptide ABC transporter permease [Chloroflexota bacterium]
MARFVLRRILWMFLVLFVVSLITFVLQHQVPGGPFSSEKKLPPEIVANINAKYGLDKPLYQQYIKYAGDILVPRYNSSGQARRTSQLSDYLINIKIGDGYLQWMNFGPSYKSRTRTVNDIFRENLPVSFQLGVLALLVGTVVGMPLGILAALRQNSAWDYAGMAVAIFGVSVPVIVLGPLFIWIFGVTLRWFPVSGWGNPSQMVMPSIALGLGSSALIARLTRASLLQVVREDYIRTARAKGLSEQVIIIRHALKNALIPVVTVLGPLFAALVTGTFVTETIFGIPGMGRYFVSSITNRDYPVIMGTILLYAVFLVLANLVVDIMYAFLDPRVRLA